MRWVTSVFATIGLLALIVPNDASHAQTVRTSEEVISDAQDLFDGTVDWTDPQRMGTIARLVMVKYQDDDLSAVDFMLNKTSDDATVCAEIARSFDVFMTAASRSDRNRDLTYGRMRYMQRVHDRSDLACSQVQTKIAELRTSLDAYRNNLNCDRINLSNWDSRACLESRNMNMYGRYGAVFDELSNNDLCYIMQNTRNNMLRRVTFQHWEARTAGLGATCPAPN